MGCETLWVVAAGKSCSASQAATLTSFSASRQYSLDRAIRATTGAEDRRKSAFSPNLIRSASELSRPATWYATVRARAALSALNPERCCWTRAAWLHFRAAE